MDQKLGQLPMLEEDREYLRKRKLLLRMLFAFVLTLALFYGLQAVVTDLETGSWVCQNGEWVQQGQPGTPPPPASQCQAHNIGKVPEQRFVQNAAVTDSAVPAEAVRFLDRGRLVRGLPGLEPGQLYLAYDRYGIGIDKLPIHYVETSVCTIGDKVVACSDPRIDNGVRVELSGAMYQRRIYVTELHVLGADEF